MSDSPQTISFVTSLYRTGSALPEFYRRCRQIADTLGLRHEFVIVNDASPDNALDVARGLAAADSAVCVIDLSRNFGQHKAIWTGLQHATGELIAALDSDLEDDPQWLLTFHEHLRREQADVAYGVHERPKGTRRYQLGRTVFFRLLNLLSGEDFPDRAATARLMTRRYINALLSHPEHELFLLGLWHTTGFKQVAIPVASQHRSETSYNFFSLASLFVRAVTSFSIAPLLAVFTSGIVISAASLLFIAYLFVQKLWFGIGVEGWASVMAAVLLVGGLTASFNGIIAIYVGTIFLEVKKRPVLIRETINPTAPHATASTQPTQSNAYETLEKDR